jgi:hypothetical protein
MRFDAVLRTFTDFFESEGMRYAVIGGLAVHAWGLSRNTQDVDFAVDLSVREQLIAFIESLGYRTLHASEGYSNHEHPSPDFGRVDIMYVTGVTAEKLFSTTESKLIAGDIRAPVARPELLAAMKATAMRNAPDRIHGDAADVQFLLSIPGVDQMRSGITLPSADC